MLLNLQTVFESEFVSVRHAIARPSPAPISEVYHGADDLLLMPISGLFAKHDSPRQHTVANPNHALFFGYGEPYRISFPGDVGDESLVIKFSAETLTDMLTQTAGVEKLCSPALNTHCLLSPASVLEREWLWRQLRSPVAVPLAIEELCLSLLSASVRAAYKDGPANSSARHSSTMARRRQQIEIVKEAISLHPSQEWRLDTLARHAGTSPYHLARVFREEVGVPVHRYLLRTRLAKALESLRETDVGLTDIAIDTGFAHHSHLTASFRSLFGVTPSQARRQLSAH